MTLTQRILSFLLALSVVAVWLTVPQGYFAEGMWISADPARARLMPLPVLPVLASRLFVLLASGSLLILAAGGPVAQEVTFTLLFGPLGRNDNRQGGLASERGSIGAGIVVGFTLAFFANKTPQGAVIAFLLGGATTAGIWSWLSSIARRAYLPDSTALSTAAPPATRSPHHTA